MDTHESVGIGSDFLGYRIEELIGRGGMGVVYRAYDLRLKRPVALKLVAPPLARDERFRERFARESELVMSLEHPNVIPIYDAGDVGGHVYLAMRLVDGTDLGSLLRNEGALEPARTMVICTQIAAALDAAHTRGLVHRDVKPSNVLLDSSDHVYLADFGLTRSLDDDGAAPDEDGSLGTPAYLAPEQLEGRPADGRSDVYSLGCLLYDCLLGEPVFPRTSRLAVAWAHLEEEPPRPSRQRAGLPDPIDAVIGRALAKEPAARYPTCGALIAAAGEALGLETPQTARRRRSLVLAGTIALAIAGAAALIATNLSHGGPLRAGPNALARIDPATGKVSRVIQVGTDPLAAAGSDYTVWVYNRGSETISQVDGSTDRLVATTHVSRPAECCSLFTGPVLAADPVSAGNDAWFVEGGTAGSRSRLVRLSVGNGGKVEYPLPITPTGVASSGSAVWVVGHDSRHDEVLRIDPHTGRVAAALRRPRSAGIDSIAFGYGRVWVLSSGRAILYRIAPHPLSWQGSLSLPAGNSRAVRPEIMHRGPDVWVRATDGMTYEIKPKSLEIYNSEPDGRPGWEQNLGEIGSLWWYDWRHGAVFRQEAAGGPVQAIRVTRSRPAAGGQCLTSMAVAAASLWVTVASSSNHVCKRY